MNEANDIVASFYIEISAIINGNKQNIFDKVAIIIKFQYILQNQKLILFGDILKKLHQETAPECLEKSHSIY